MKFTNALEISFIIAGAVYTCSLYIGKVRIENILSYFLDSYIKWFVNVFRFRPDGRGGYRPSFHRTLIFSLSMSIIISIIFELSGYEIFTQMIDMIDIYERARKVTNNVSNPMHTLVHLMMVQVMVTAIAILFANFFFDRLSIIQSFWLARKIRGKPIIKIPIFIIIDFFLSSLFAFSAVFCAFLMYTVATYIMFVISVPSMLKFDIYNMDFYMNFCIGVYKLLKQMLLAEIFIANSAGLIIDIRSLHSIMYWHPYIGPVFITTLLTVVWFIIYYCIVLCMNGIKSFRQIDEKLSKLGENKNNGHVVGGIGAGTIFIVFWVLYFCYFYIA